MKLSISLPEAAVAAIDEYAEAAALGSRSAVVQHAITLLARERLQEDYAAAWQEWDASPDHAAWESVSLDGLG